MNKLTYQTLIMLLQTNSNFDFTLNTNSIS